MTLLSRPEILAALEAGDIIIDPFDERNLGTASYDVTIGPHIYRESGAQYITEVAGTDVAGEIYPWLPVRWLSRLRHATVDYVRHVRCPVLVVHSRDDEIIPFRHGEAIFAAAPEPRRFLELHGSHNDAFLRDGNVYVEGLSEFLTGL